MENVGLTAYFPHPRFIIEEQRTELKNSNPPGQTINSDTRSIEPIYTYSRKPLRNSKKSPPPPAIFCNKLLQELDNARRKDEQAFLAVNPSSRPKDQDSSKREYALWGFANGASASMKMSRGLTATPFAVINAIPPLLKPGTASGRE